MVFGLPRRFLTTSTGASMALGEFLGGASGGVSGGASPEFVKTHSFEFVEFEQSFEHSFEFVKFVEFVEFAKTHLSERSGASVVDSRVTILCS